MGIAEGLWIVIARTGGAGTSIDTSLGRSSNAFCVEGSTADLRAQ
jgi:hypothetical protein